MKFDFGRVFSRPFQILWKYKSLWVFGLLASCSQWNINLQSFSRRERLPIENLPPSFQQAYAYVQSNWWVIPVIILGVVILAFISILIGTIGRVGLIKGTLKAETGLDIPFVENWSESFPYFWRVFGLSFFIGMFFIIFVYGPMIVFETITLGIGALCTAPLYCLLVPLGIVLNQIVELGNVSIVKEDLGIVDAFKKGWSLFRANIGPVLISAFVLWIITTLITLVIGIPIFVISIPALTAYQFTDQSSLPLILGGICFTIYLPVYWFINGLLTTYRGSAWTLIYLELTTPKPIENTPVPAQNA